VQKVEQSLEDADFADQPQNWSLNPATAKTAARFLSFAVFQPFISQ